MPPQKQQKTFDQFIKELDLLSKKNTGSGLFQGADVTSNLPMYIPGRAVADPMGLGDRRVEEQPQFYQPPQQSFNQPYFNQLPELPQAPDLSFLDQSYDYTQQSEQPQYYTPEYQEAVNNPVMATTEQAEQAKRTTGREYGIASMQDGGTLYSDGLVRYEDGTVRQYNPAQPQAYGIASMQDGSIRYSDGSIRRPATPKESQVQSITPTPIASLEGGRVLYSDGIIREYRAPQGATPAAPKMEVSQTQDDANSSGVVDFFKDYGQGYRFNAGKNDMKGECAWFSQQITTLEGGGGWPVGNTIQEKRRSFERYRANGHAFRPGEDQVKPGNSIIFDLGTKYGHVATISEIFTGQDGKKYYRLTESNMTPKTVDHTRVVPADDRKIVGYMKTVPLSRYKTTGYENAPEIDFSRSEAKNTNVSPSAPQDAPQGSVTKETLQSLPPVSMNQSRSYDANRVAASMMPDARTGQVLGAFTSEPYAAKSKDAPKIQASGMTGQFASNPMNYDQMTAQSPAASALSSFTDLFSPPTFEDKKQEPVAQAPVQASGPDARFASNPQNYSQQDQAQATAPASRGIATGQPQASVNRSITPQQPQGQVLGASTSIPSDMSGAGEQLMSKAPIQASGMSSEFAANPMNYSPAPQKTYSGLASKGLAGKAKEIYSAVAPTLQNVFQKTNDLVENQKVKEKISEAKPEENIFERKDLSKLDPKKMVGDSPTTDNSALLNIESNSMVRPETLAEKNDIRDPFFKGGGAEAYKDYLKNPLDNTYGGALTLDLFKNNIFEIPEYVGAVFGNTGLGKQATQKYKDYLGSKIQAGGDSPTKRYREVIDGETYEWEDVNPTYYENQFWREQINKTPEVLRNESAEFKPEARATQGKKQDYQGFMSSVNPFQSGSVIRDLSSAVSQFAGKDKKENIASLPTISRVLSAAAPIASKPVAQLAQNIFKTSGPGASLSSIAKAVVSAATPSKPSTPQPSRPSAPSPSKPSSSPVQSASRAVQSVAKAAAPVVQKAVQNVQKAAPVVQKQAQSIAQKAAPTVNRVVQAASKVSPVVRVISNVINSLFRRR